MNILRAHHSNPYNPYHLSVGVILLNKGRILLEKKENCIADKPCYLLPTETMLMSESLESTIRRLLCEEIKLEYLFPCENTNCLFLGSTISEDDWWAELGDAKRVFKTTLWFQLEVDDAFMELFAKRSLTTTHEWINVDKASEIFEWQIEKSPLKFLDFTNVLSKASL